MKIKYMLSDISFPPSEGLHQQTLLLMRGMVRSGHEVVVSAFVGPKSSVDIDGLRDYVGTRDIELHPTKLGWTTRALMATSAIGRRLSGATLLTGSFASFGPQLIHIEGIGAMGAMAPGLYHRTILNLIDPGSRRYLRMSETKSGPKRILYKLISELHRTLEQYVMTKLIPINVVSSSDKSYMDKNVFDRDLITNITVMLPVSEGVAAIPWEIEGTDDYVLIHCDLRQEHMREAMSRLIVSAKNTRISVKAPSVKVLGRVASFEGLPEEIAGGSWEVLNWVDDYASYASRALAVIVPDTFGTGIKNRTVQAMAAGALVMATEVALEGIPHQAMEDVIPFSVDEDWLWQTGTIRDSAERQRSIRINARKNALDNFGADSVLGRWENAYADRCERGGMQ